MSCCAFVMLSLTPPLSSQVKKKGLLRTSLCGDVKVGLLITSGFKLPCARAVHLVDSAVDNKGKEVTHIQCISRLGLFETVVRSFKRLGLFLRSLFSAFA